MAEEIEAADPIAEYETQLAGIEELLAASPNDQSLLALKNDLVELLKLTKGNNDTEPEQSIVNNEEKAADDLPPPPPQNENPVEEGTAGDADASGENDKAAIQAVAMGTARATNVVEDTAPAATKKKKTKKVKEFVVPPHLIVQEQDSEAEIKKKRRALKALKSQHRERRKEVEHEQKQKSWQSFQKKKKSGGSSNINYGSGGGSIFYTQENVDDRVGVISKRTKTEFGQRKRHKHV